MSINHFKNMTVRDLDYRKMMTEIQAVAKNLSLTISVKEIYEEGKVEIILISIPKQLNDNAVIFRTKVKTIVIEFCETHDEDIGITIDDDINEEKVST